MFICDTGPMGMVVITFCLHQPTNLYWHSHVAMRTRHEYCPLRLCLPIMKPVLGKYPYLLASGNKYFYMFSESNNMRWIKHWSIICWELCPLSEHYLDR